MTNDPLSKVEKLKEQIQLTLGEPPPEPRKPKRKVTGAQELLMCFMNFYKLKYNRPYVPSWGKDSAILKKLFEDSGSDMMRMKNKIAGYFGFCSTQAEKPSPMHFRWVFNQIPVHGEKITVGTKGEEDNDESRIPDYPSFGYY